MGKKRIIVLISLILAVLFSLTGCGKAGGSESQASVSRTESTGSFDAGTVNGDGTITVSLNISNPEQKQEKYNLIFATESSFIDGEPVRFFKSYTVDTETPITVRISELIYYAWVDDSDNFAIGLTVARLEDVNVRNPLSAIIPLTFPDLQTCNQGKDITLDMTDEPLNSMYSEGTLLIRIVDPQGQGGYVDFLYKDMSGTTLTYGRGSSGPDFLVAFDAADFKDMGIRDAVLVITDEKSKHISAEVELKFDENGYCKQGQYIEMEVSR